MLGKLIKYDLKYGFRIFAVLHIILLLAAVAGRCFFLERINFQADEAALAMPLAIFISLYVLLYTCINIGSTILVIARFYKNLFTDEGYLSWTIPATPLEQLWAKIISGGIWYLLNFIISALSLFILVSGKNVTAAYAVIAPEITEALGISLSGYILCYVPLFIIGTICSPIILYCCISVGQLFPGHRLLCAIVTYCIISSITSIFECIIMIAADAFPGYNTTVSAAPFTALTDMMFWNCALVVVFSFLEYIVTHYIMTRKINLL